MRNGAASVIPVCLLSELPEGQAVRVAGRAPEGQAPIAVFHAEGALYAVDDTCTHQDASLADGYLEGCLVECPLHAATFDLRTGRPTGPPATRAVRTHEVTVQDGTVYVVPSAVPA